MSNREREKVNELIIDEWIWIVFIILSLLNIGGDEYLKDYCYNHNDHEKNLSRKIFNFTIFISFLIYIYLATKDYHKYCKKRDNKENATLEITRCIGSALVVIATFLFLIVQLKDNKAINPDIE